MSKQFELNIPKPCSENWDNMSPSEKGRFCGSCEKQVIDFTMMNERQIAVFFKKKNRSVCGRFNADQLDATYTIPKKRIPWVRYFFQIALPAFLYSTKLDAQQRIIKPESLEFILRNAAKSLNISENISPATSDTFPKGEKYSGLTGVAGEVVMVGGCIRGKVVSKRPMDSLNVKRRLPRTIENLFKSGFLSYPNPITIGSNITLKWQNMPEGEFEMSLFNTAGQILHTREFSLQKNEEETGFSMPSLKQGTYVITVTEKKTGKSWSQKILVE